MIVEIIKLAGILALLGLAYWHGRLSVIREARMQIDVLIEVTTLVAEHNGDLVPAKGVLENLRRIKKEL